MPISHRAKRTRKFLPTLVSLEGRKLLSGTWSWGWGWNQPNTISAVSADPIAVRLHDPLPSLVAKVSDSGHVAPNYWVDYGDGARSYYQQATWSMTGNTYFVEPSFGHTYQSVGMYVVKVHLDDWTGASQEIDVSVDVYDITVEEAEPVGTAKDVVGANVTFVADLISLNPRATILNVTCDVTDSLGHDGVITSQTINRTGFHNETGRTLSKTEGLPGTKTSLLGGNYWNETPGVHTAKMTLRWEEPDPGAFGVWTIYTKDLIKTFDVKAPTANVTTRVASTRIGKDSKGFDILASGFAIDVDTTAQSGQFDGKIGVVQTSQTATYRWWTDPASGVKYQRQYYARQTGPANARYAPKTLLDNTEKDENGGVFTPYYGTFDKPPVLTEPIGGLLTRIDGPNSRFRTQFDRLYVSDAFTDTVMFIPTGGIAVPLGNLEWIWGGDVTRDAQKAPVLSWKEGPTATDYTASTDWPAWDDVRENLEGTFFETVATS